MITSELNSVTAETTQLASSGPAVLGKEDFLNLLITQLQNQDPLNPTDSTEFTAQLAQFSSLEQLTNVNDNLEELQKYEASINNSQAVTLIGKEITAKGNSLSLTADKQVGCDFSIEESAAMVVVSIYDSTGEFVKSFKKENLEAGEHTLFWDGTNEDDKRMAEGAYTFELQASDTKGKDIKTTTFFSGTVDKVTFDNNQAYLISKTQKIAIGDVIRVGVPEK
jgi:flagellar basal-body rod modification protein FlgD